MNKKKASAYRILVVIILSAILLAALFLIVFLIPNLREDMKKAIVFPYLVFEMVITPIVYGVGAAVLLSILALRKDIEVRNNKVRRLLLVLSTVIVTLYVLGVIYFTMTFNNEGYPEFCWQIIEWLIANPFVFSILGIAFFFAINRYHKEVPEPNEIK